MSSDLTALMQRTTADLQPGPEFVKLAHRAGRRRLVRRRLQATGLAVSLLAAAPVAAGIVHHTPRAAPVVFGGPLDDGRTHGDLAADPAYARAVLSRWGSWRRGDDQHRFTHPLGEPWLAWAGSTPAGPAALVVQRMRSRDGVERVAVGYVGTNRESPSSGAAELSPAGPRIVGATLDGSGFRRDEAWYVDPARRVLAVIDGGTRRGISTRWTYTPDGQARHRYVPVTFHDGVAVTSVPTGAYNATQVADVAGDKATSRVGIAGLIVDDLKVRGLRWNAHGKYDTLIPTAGATEAIGSPMALSTVDAVTHANLVALDAHTDPGYGGLMPTWAVYGVTPDGRRFSVFERALDSDPARLYLLLGGRLSDHGVVHAERPLPVAIALSDRQGWVVAQYGAALRYRVGAGAWHDAGRSAALLPPAATDVEVTRPGGRAAIVALRTA